MSRRGGQRPAILSSCVSECQQLLGFQALNNCAHLLYCTMGPCMEHKTVQLHEPADILVCTQDFSAHELQQHLSSLRHVSHDLRGAVPSRVVLLARFPVVVHELIRLIAECLSRGCCQTSHRSVDTGNGSAFDDSLSSYFPYPMAVSAWSYGCIVCRGTDIG